MPFNKRKHPMTSPPGAAIPPDDANNKLTVANPDDPKLRHISVAGGTYTILVTGEQTGGRYCLIDMLVPPGGGPPPHRHDFEEMFTILEVRSRLPLGVSNRCCEPARLPTFL